ncbi:MAG TPA: thiol:disulfide interchange protein DsbA/DsbL [Lautropia sp.]|nr:thiol:disulfide interchange protein DsbA/DsbL [Lautropia sp.]
MNRKQFLTLAASGAASAAVPWVPARAQGAEPRFRSLKAPAPTDAEAGKIEVIEFFWFGCPHCYTLEPLINAWAKKQPPDVVFRRQHVPFREVKHQQLYFTLQALGQDNEKVMNAVFNAIHQQRLRMLDPKEMTEVLAPVGVDAKAFNEAFNSFGVKTRQTRANKLADAYDLDGVPAIGVNGKYLTAPSLAGSNEGALRVVDELIARERKGA